MLSKLFSNYFKTINIENVQSAKNQTGLIFFNLKIAQ